MKYKTNNTLKERPIIFGLKDTNFIYVAFAVLIVFVASFMGSELFGFSVGAGIIGTIVIGALIFWLMIRVQGRQDDSDLFLDRYITYKQFQKVKKFSAGYSNNKNFKKSRWDYLTSFLK